MNSRNLRPTPLFVLTWPAVTDVFGAIGTGRILPPFPNEWKSSDLGIEWAEEPSRTDAKDLAGQLPVVRRAVRVRRVLEDRLPEARGFG
jgi:hypothetical protein